MEEETARLAGDLGEGSVVGEMEVRWLSGGRMAPVDGSREVDASS